eukprot:TRINITY_DN1935_c0_g2_i1.p1 TRINITY_DN1935_c0_g2~~TRINITY_DN1935_c0_g2_i1.p1  ORF type:complete len:504 (-),score=122.94 TRINITY_DN1935_c0_g2_i1:599-2110(-)
MSSEAVGVPAGVLQKYKVFSKKGEGTFSEVLKAQSLKSGELVAIKRMKNHFESIEQVNSLREIQALKRLSPHPNVIKLVEYIFDRATGRLALVFELMDMNLYEMIRGRRQYLSDKKVRWYMYQLMKALDFMHQNGIFHRDIKPENILVREDRLKLADFGSCRGVYSKQPYTEYIATRWYRPPECLLTDGYYTYKMDMWGSGCVFFEIMSLYPLFPGANELDQIQKIHNIMGTPPQEILAKFKRYSTHINFNFPQKEGSGIVKPLPHASPECLDLMQKLLTYNPDERITARQSLRHAYFKELRDQEKKANAAATRESGQSTSSASGQQQPQSQGSSESSNSHAQPSKQRYTKKADDSGQTDKLPNIGKDAAPLSLPGITQAHRNASLNSVKESARNDHDGSDSTKPASSSLISTTGSTLQESDTLPTLVKAAAAQEAPMDPQDLERGDAEPTTLPPINMNMNGTSTNHMASNLGAGANKAAAKPKKHKKKSKHSRAQASTDSDD